MSNHKERMDQLVEKLLGRDSESLKGRPEGKDLKEKETKVNKESLHKARFELLASNLWSKLGDTQAIIEEVNPSELRLKVGDLSWKLNLKDDARVSISGFDSGVEQYLGMIPEENAEHAILEISENALELIQEEIEENKEPPKPPIHFGPDEDDEVEEEIEDNVGPDEEMMEGDEGMEEESADLGAEFLDMPMDDGMGQPQMDPMYQPPAQDPMSMGQPQMPQPPMNGGQPQMPQQPIPMGQPQMPQQPNPFPMASREGIAREQVRQRNRTASVKRMAHVLDGVADELTRCGQIIDDGPDGVFTELAARIDKITNTIESTS